MNWVDFGFPPPRGIGLSTGWPKKYLKDCLNNISGFKYAKLLIRISFFYDIREPI